MSLHIFHRSGCSHCDRFFPGGVDECYLSGVQADAAVRVGAAGTVFQVALYGASYRGELTADLMVSSGHQLHFYKKIVFCGSEQAVAQYGFLGTCLGFRPGVGLVLLLVTGKPGTDLSLRRLRGLLHQCPVDFPSTTIPEGFLAMMTAPLTGRSRRWGTPMNTLPGLWSLAAMNGFSFSGSGSSPVLSPCVISPARLLKTSTWLSS